MPVARPLRPLRVVSVVLAVFVASGCAGSQSRKTRPLRRLRDLAPAHGKIVTIEGVYRRINLGAHANQTVRLRRAYVVLADGATVLVDTGSRGQRPTRELDKFAGKYVVLRGMFRRRCNAWGTGRRATLVAPCVRDVTIVSSAVR